MKNKVSFSKLLPITLSRLKQIGVYFVSSIGILIVLLVAKGFVNDKLEAKYKLEDDIQKAKTEYNSKLSTLRQKERELTSMESLTSKLIDKDTFVTFIGKVADAADVTIMSLESGGSKSTSSVTSVNFRFELKGELKNVNKVVEAIDSLETTYNIRKMSMRKNGEYLWLDRATDKVSSSWFQFDKSTVNLNPQTIPLPESLPEIVLNEKGEIVEIKDKRLTSVEDLMEGEKISLYLDISFLIAG